MFFTVKDTLNAGRCSQSAVEAPTTCRLGLPAAQFASSHLSWSEPPVTLLIDSPEYLNVV